MAVPKTKDMNWRRYLRALAESSSSHISDIERVELSGYLLRRDIEIAEKPGIVLNEIFSKYNYEIADLIAGFLIAESPDTTTDLLLSIRNLVVDRYTNHIDHLLKEEAQTLKEEREIDGPEDEHYEDPYQGH